MRVYHGSTAIVDKPEVLFGRKNLDFGRGFYMTEIEQQAIDWTQRPINSGKAQYLNCYELDMQNIRTSEYRYKIFEAYNDEWFDFVLANRHSEDIPVKYDVVEGGIANDHVFNTIELYDAGLITREEALSRLRYEKPNNQICILNQEIIDRHLTFITAKRLN